MNANTTYINMNLYNSDCLSILPTLPPNHFHSLITDPPAGISFMGKKWDNNKGGRKEWVAWLASIMEQCYRVLRPGSHCLVWALPRTSHLTTTAIEDAGFEIRDIVYHLFGQGFPKSMDVSKAIDKRLGAERERIISKLDAGVWNSKKGQPGGNEGWERPWMANPDSDPYWITAPATDQAKQWEGWGTGLKPAVECWIMARKPLSEKTVADNVLRWGVGGINIDGCRIGDRKDSPQVSGAKRGSNAYGKIDVDGGKVYTEGRFPANLITDGSPEIVAGFPTSKSQASIRRKKGSVIGNGITHADGRKSHYDAMGGFDDEGSAARFFYCPKASRAERESGCNGLAKQFLATMGDGIGKREHNETEPNAWAKNNHPTVKPLALMRYLARLITPPSGTVLDCFMGSGSTGIAAIQEGFDFVGIEMEQEYFNIASARLSQPMK